MKIKLETGWQLLVFILVMLGLLFAIIVFQLWLWNILFVAVFELPQLTFWQMVALDVFWNTISYQDNNLISVKYKGEEM